MNEVPLASKNSMPVIGDVPGDLAPRRRFSRRSSLENVIPGLHTLTVSGTNRRAAALLTESPQTTASSVGRRNYNLLVNNGERTGLFSTGISRQPFKSFLSRTGSLTAAETCWHVHPNLSTYALFVSKCRAASPAEQERDSIGELASPAVRGCDGLNMMVLLKTKPLSHGR
jgi:hypothetical protein